MQAHRRRRDNYILINFPHEYWQHLGHPLLFLDEGDMGRREVDITEVDHVQYHFYRHREVPDLLYVVRSKHENGENAKTVYRMDCWLSALHMFSAEANRYLGDELEVAIMQDVLPARPPRRHFDEEFITALQAGQKVPPRGLPEVLEEQLEKAVADYACDSCAQGKEG